MQEHLPEFAIRVHDLVVGFGQQVVIDHLSLDVRRGEILGLVGASGTAGDHDGDDQDTEFAQHQNADHVDDIGIRAEFPKMEKSLLGDDGTDQEGDQHHDRDRLPADPVELIDQ